MQADQTDEMAEAKIDETVAAAGVTKDSEPWRDRVARMASEVAAREGCEIYDFDFIGGSNNRSLRVFIDKVGPEGSPKGVSIEDCSNVSRGLNLLLDVDDVIPGGAYNLEVSSPGLERPLRSSVHFKRAAGTRAFVKTFESFAELNSELGEATKMKLGKSKQLEGTVIGVEGDDIPAGTFRTATEAEAGHDHAVLVFDAETGGDVIRVRLPLAKITKANTVFIFETNDKPTGKKKK